MSTVIFDFDSTLIRRESLEEILAPKCSQDPTLEPRIREITALGMEGKISFKESLSRRLALAAPSLQEVHAFGDNAAELLSPGMEELVKELLDRQVSVRIISGGLKEAILPVARYLGLKDEDVGAVSLRFAADGSFLGIDPEDPFSDTKLAGAQALAPSWSRPAIAVGDGMTDYHLYQHGLVNTFIAYTQWARRESVVATGVPEARDVQALSRLLEELL